MDRLEPSVQALPDPQELLVLRARRLLGPLALRVLLLLVRQGPQALQ